MNALPGHAFTVVRMTEKGGGDGQMGSNHSRGAIVKQK